MGGVTWTCLVEQKIWSLPPFLPSFLASIFCLAQFAQSCKQSEGLLRVFRLIFLGDILDFMRSRAVKMFLISRLIMNSRQLQNLHQRHKFLKAEASRDISKIKSFGNGISRCFQEVFSTTDTMLFCLHPRLGTTSLKCPRHSTTLHGSSISQIYTCLNMNSMSFKTARQNDALQFYLIRCSFFLLAIMVEGDESGWLTSWWFWPATGPYWQPGLEILKFIQATHAYIFHFKHISSNSGDSIPLWQNILSKCLQSN